MTETREQRIERWAREVDNLAFCVPKDDYPAEASRRDAKKQSAVSVATRIDASNTAAGLVLVSRADLVEVVENAVADFPGNRMDQAIEALRKASGG